MDRRWRRRAIEALKLTGSERLLDCVHGTGDRRDCRGQPPFRRRRRVVGVDFSGAMLRIGLEKCAARRSNRASALAQAMRRNSRAGSIVRRGHRRVRHPQRRRSRWRVPRVHRVLGPGGRARDSRIRRAAARRVFRCVYRTYFRHIVPRIGRAISRHREAYEYLPESVSQFPSNQAFADVLRRAGFSSVTPSQMMMGAVYLYLATRD
jgi:demethylmenaquinone methyltransferase/2-methoxy-6-polyprenyl-1,4-benzoquinol methylase